MSSGKRPSGTPLRTRVLLIGASVVVLVLAIVGVALITPTLSEDSTPVATSPEPSPVLPAPQVVPVPSDAPKPSPAGLEAVLAAPCAIPIWAASPDPSRTRSPVRCCGAPMRTPP